MESGLLIDGRYRLLERLGRGGMSVVWRAEDDVLGREVAVKVLSAHLAADGTLLHQLRAEARAAAGLRHAMVVQVHDYGETTYRNQVLPYVVMELVDGRTMSQLLSGDSIPWRLAVLICAQVSAALAAAHAHGVVHRDVKPGNVMITSSGVKLVDFGISATIGATDGADGQLLGTPAYLAPERLKGDPVRPAADVYALGLLLYLSLSGRMPWQASTTTQMLRAHYYVEPAPLPAVPGLPSEVACLVTRCLAKRPDQRPSAAEVARVLGDIAGLPPAALMDAAKDPTVSINIPGRRPHRVAGAASANTARVPGGRRTLIAAAASIAVIGTGLAAWTAGNLRGPAPAVAGPTPAACSATPLDQGRAAAPQSITVNGTTCREEITSPPSPTTSIAAPAGTREPGRNSATGVAAAVQPASAAMEAAPARPSTAPTSRSKAKVKAETEAKAKNKNKSKSKTKD